MILTRGLLNRSGITRLLVSGLVALLVLGTTLGVACSKSVPSAAPETAPVEKITPPEAESTPAGETAPPETEAAPLPVAVDISGFAFKPNTTTVAVGTTVTRTNRDSVGHTTSSRNAGLFDSGVLSSGAAYSYTFAEAGTFDYYCKIHPSMTAKVIVE